MDLERLERKERFWDGVLSMKSIIQGEMGGVVEKSAGDHSMSESGAEQ